MGLKVAVVGGGSTYTPELVEGFARRAAVLPIDELVLMDPDKDRLDVGGGLAGRILARHGWPGRLILTGDRSAALDGAAFTLIQLRVGGQATRLVDETLPLKFGLIGQETTGPGGFAKALRTVPLVLDIAEEAASRGAPGSWILDFTNPVGIVAQALLDAWHRALGLCNGAIPSYYLRYYYAPREVLRHQLDGATRAEDVIAIERELLELYKDPALDHKPELLERRGGAYYSEAAAALIESLHTGDGAIHVVDARNDGAIPNLPDDAVVETPARITRSEAELSGSDEVAYRALLANPVVPSAAAARGLRDAIIEANLRYLPRFVSSIG